MLGDISVDLDEFAFNKTSDELKKNFRAIYGDKIADEVLPVLEEGDLIEWFDVVYENRDKITNLDSAIGTKDFNLDELLNQNELLKTLAQSEKVTWNDPAKFGSVLHYALAQAVEDKFENDEEYLKYLREETEMDNEQIETLSQVSDSEIPSFLNLSDEFDSKIAKKYAVLSSVTGIGIVDNWDNQPSVGQYIVYTVTKDGYDKTGTIVLEVVGVETEEIMLSDLSEDFANDEEDVLLETIDSFVVQSVSYEDTVLDLYENHYLIGDANETSILEPTKEKNIDGIYDENPIPLTD